MSSTNLFSGKKAIKSSQFLPVCQFSRFAFYMNEKRKRKSKKKQEKARKRKKKKEKE